MNEYRRRHEALLALRMSGTERVVAFLVGFFGETVGVLFFVLSIYVSVRAGLGFFEDATSEKTIVDFAKLGGAVLLSGALFYLGLRTLRYCHTRLTSAVSGFREQEDRK